MKWNQHNNDIGDQCPHSGGPVDQAELDEHGEDARCPALCRGSLAMEDDED